MIKDLDIIVFIMKEDLESFIKYYNPNNARRKWKCPNKFSGWKNSVNLILSKDFKDKTKQLKMLDHIIKKDVDRDSGVHSWMDDYVPGSTKNDYPLMHFIRKNINTRSINKKLNKNLDHYLTMMNTLITHSSRDSIRKAFFHLEYESRVTGNRHKEKCLYMARLIIKKIIKKDYCHMIEDKLEFRYDQIENILSFIVNNRMLDDLSALVKNGYLSEINVYLKRNADQEAQKKILPYLL